MLTVITSGIYLKSASNAYLCPQREEMEQNGVSLVTPPLIELNLHYLPLFLSLKLFLNWQEQIHDIIVSLMVNNSKLEIL